jgi:hypothetical protein
MLFSSLKLTVYNEHLQTYSTAYVNDQLMVKIDFTQKQNVFFPRGKDAPEIHFCVNYL